MSVPAKTRPVLITGCSSGIGKATAVRLSKAGWNVYASARRLDAIADLQNSGCKLVELDMLDEASMTTAVQQIERESGALAGLINNAGYSQSGAVESVSMELVRRQFETNVFGLVRLTQLVLPGMREAGSGRIINIGSMGGKLTFPGGGYYHATKYSLEALSDALRFEVDGFGVKVVLIEPGLITTEFGNRAVSGIGELDLGDGPYAAFNSEVSATTAGAYEGPMARLGAGPDKVAKVIERALGSTSPKPRYKITLSARVMLAIHAVVSDRMWDRMMRQQFSSPGRSK